MAKNSNFIERQIYLKTREHLKNKEITVITGMRRVGKTTIVNKLLEDIDSKNKAYFDLEKITNRIIFDEKNYDNIISLIEKDAGISFEEKAYIAIDEIQLSPNIASVLKYLYDHYDIKFIVTGSSSFYIKNLFTESLAGRKIIFEAYPLDFSEFLKFKGMRYGQREDFIKSKFSFQEHEKLKLFYDEFIEYGGFPEVVLADDFEYKKKKILEIINTYVSLDIASISDFKEDRETYSLIKMLAGRIGSRIDNSKLSILSGLSRDNIANYLDFFEETYLISRVPVFTTNNDREIVKAKKLYFIDTGIANVLADLSSGAKFENTVFNQLKHFGEVRYYALKTGQEIDFVLFQGKNSPIALEAKETPVKKDIINTLKYSKIAGIGRTRIIGRHISPGFDDYIWGGSIRGASITG